MKLPDLNLTYWGILAARSDACGRQAWYFSEQDIYFATEPPQRSVFRITWDIDGNESLVYWCGVGNGYDGQGWTDDLRIASEFPSRDEADVELRAARKSVDGARRAMVQVEEFEQGRRAA